MELIYILFWWSIIGVIPWLFICLRKWAKTRPNEISINDFYRALPFGLIVISAFLGTYLTIYMGQRSIMKYGVFGDIDEDVQHVVPCDEGGKILSPHILDEICQCEPKVYKSTIGTIIVHNSYN
ncbi:MAG: hypothetical protein KAS32_27770 [Candidatus Peribacteraceae bacterium]|nr:hypothetical protein [Candidatus Peribacteraceae bacterium]